MPLAVAKISFKATLNSIFSDLGTGEPYPTAADKAQQVAAAIHTLLIAGVPQTMDTGEAAAGQTVAVFLTTTPGTISGTGTGGLDKSSSGAGLDSSRSAFVDDMKALFKNYADSFDIAAGDWADYLVTLYSEAKVMTQVTGVFLPGAPVAPLVPPVTGTVGTGSWSGTGTGSIESDSGSGLVEGDLSSAIEAIFSDLSSGNTADVAAGKIADAVIAFAKTAAITTTDMGTAGGGLATITPPAPPYPGGDGVTTSASPIITGTGTGALI
jgi:hypothetical protein